jgi:alpha-tubulin suppressor-like RCC1 family protein
VAVSLLSVVALGILLLPAVVSAGPAGAAAPGTYDWGSVNSALTPTLVPGVSGEVFIDAGNSSDLAVLANGTVVGWGETEVAPPSLTPVAIPGLTDVLQTVDGDHDFAALEAPGPIVAGTCPSSTVWTWGYNYHGDLGIGDSNNDTYGKPQEVNALTGLGVVQVVAAGKHMYALTCDGDVYMWGANLQGDLAGLASVTTPTLNPTVTALTGGSSTGVMLTTGQSEGDIMIDGTVYSWGNNNMDQCGCGSSAAVVTTPTRVTQSVPFTWIDAGGFGKLDGHVLALDSSGRAWCWGDNEDGQCGQGTTTDVPSPVVVPGLPSVTMALAGGVHSMFLDATGDVWTCGGNSVGQVGNGKKTNRLTVKKVLTGMTMISAGALHSLAAS